MIDKTTVEVIRGALVYAAEEMGIALKKSAYSPNIKERMDYSCALFEPKRRLIAQRSTFPSTSAQWLWVCVKGSPPTKARSGLGT